MKRERERNKGGKEGRISDGEMKRRERKTNEGGSDREGGSDGKIRGYQEGQKEIKGDITLSEDDYIM